jgi:hypothetical protein
VSKNFCPIVFVPKNMIRSVVVIKRRMAMPAKQNVIISINLLKESAPDACICFVTEQMII